MWESDVTVRWRSFTQGDAGMRQGWISCWRQGGHVHSTEKPHWNQEQVSLMMALVITFLLSHIKRNYFSQNWQVDE